MSLKHDAWATRSIQTLKTSGCAVFNAHYADLLEQLGVNLILQLAPMVALASAFHQFGYQVPDRFCRLDEVSIGQMGIAQCRTMSPVHDLKQAIANQNLEASPTRMRRYAHKL